MDWRYRAVPCGVAITDQPGTHWLSALRTLKMKSFFRGLPIPSGALWCDDDKPVLHALAVRPADSVLIVEHTMTVAMEVRIRNLLPELLADALILLRAL